RTNPLGQTTGVFNVGYSMDASNSSNVSLFRGNVDVILQYAGAWHTAAHFTMNGMAVNGGLGVNFGGTPGVGDICAGNNVMAVGGRLYLEDGTRYLFRSGNDLYWFNGTSNVKLS